MSLPRASSAAWSVAVSVALLLVITPALAHKVIMSAWSLGEDIEGEVGFSTGEMAQPGTKVEILGPDDEVLDEAEVAEDGLFRFRPPKRVRLTLRANLGGGHVAETQLSVDELPALATPEATSTAASAATLTGAVNTIQQATTMSSRLAATTLQPDELKALITTAVQHEIRPLRRELNRLREGLRLQDVISGFGYIVGIFGLLFFVQARRQLQS